LLPQKSSSYEQIFGNIGKPKNIRSKDWKKCDADPHLENRNAGEGRLNTRRKSTDVVTAKVRLWGGGNSPVRTVTGKSKMPGRALIAYSGNATIERRP